MRSFGSDDGSRGSGGGPGQPGGWPGHFSGQARSPGRPGGGGALQGRVQQPMDGPASPGMPSGSQGAPAPTSARGPAPGPTAEARRPPAQAPTPVEAPTPALPTGGGAIRSIAEKFSANPATGTGSMAIPIATSPGRGGFGPELSVSYDSGAGNGLFGIGWSLTVPSISRKTEKGLPQYRDTLDSDTFVLSGAEDLVPLLKDAGGGKWERDVVEVPAQNERRERYRPRVEGAFARIERIINTQTHERFWRVTTKDNVVSEYGKTAASRIADPEHPGRVFRWLLDETRDDRGNVVVYRYKREDLAGVPRTAGEIHRHDAGSELANLHPKRILYGNRPSTSAPWDTSDFYFEVVFDYGEHDLTAADPTAETNPWAVRQDPFSTYRAGFEIRTYRLCQRILMFHRGLNTTPDPLLVRSTDFTYEHSGAVTYLIRAEQKGYLYDSDESRYEAFALPPVDFDYTRATFSSAVADLDPASARRLRQGVDGRAYQFVDLDGEGIPGVLTQQGGALYYGRNLGQGKLAPPRPLKTKPSGARLGQALQARGGGQQLLDVTGDGLPDLVDYGGPGSARGFYSRTPDGEWLPMRAFGQLPNVDFSDPSLRFIDLTGDGFADVVMSEDHVYTWWPSQRERGFGAPRRASRYSDEKLGPTAVFAEREQTVFLADMSGDGLQDIVRIRNGSVCYWPNLGYGRFGKKITMGGAPHMAPSNLYSPSRVRLADIDGSGTTDLLYVGADGVWVWLNQAGNRFAEGQKLAIFPGASGLSSTDVVDLLGTGTSCLVWSTPQPGRPPSVRYVDLLSSTKPHLLRSITNNLGLETRIAYASSTKLYLEDTAAGVEWATRLPFPVQVVERVEHYDDVSKHRFVSTYRYRHGFYDPEEREFRGFGYVEQRDAESVSEHLGRDPELFPDNDYPVLNGEMQLHPAVTKTWFHTGAWIRRRPLHQAYEAEWFAANPSEPRLSMPAMPAGMSAVELHQAHRALAGRMLRQEVYAADGSADADKPYAVTQQSFGAILLQPTGSAPYASFRVDPSETLTIQYERSISDPRIAHELVLEVDEFGNVVKSASVGYGLGSSPYTEVQRTWVLTSWNDFFDETASTQWYRHSVPLEAKSWEMGSALVPNDTIFTVEEIKNAWGYTEVAFDATPGTNTKRLLSHTKKRYWDETNDPPTAPLAFGQVHQRALPYQSYAKALTPTMLSSTLDDKVDDDTATGDGGYEDLDDDGSYWAKTGIQYFQARAHFCLLDKVADVFGNETTLSYDAYKLFVTSTTNALSLTTAADIDYRVLAPTTVTDINGNFTKAAFDALGRVTAIAVAGKTMGEGDTLSDPTRKITYELDRYRDSSPDDLRPARIKTEAREQHGGTATWLVSFSYFDGSGNEVQKKVEAEDGPAPKLDANGHPELDQGELQYETASPRYVGTGRTVYDNKGNPIKQYEPFFSATEEYEDDPDIVEWGVTPLLHYDPLGRLIRTDHPDGSYSRVHFTPWQQVVYDRNDTVDEAGNKWHADMSGGTTEEADAAAKALAHADTPTTTYFDGLGRPVVVVEDNSPVTYTTRSVLDIQGNLQKLIDAKDRACMTYTHGMLGQVLKQTSIDAGTRWMFGTAAGEPVKSWGERGFTHTAKYDELRRPMEKWVHDDSTSTDSLVELYVYGEKHASISTGNLHNLEGRLVLQFDQSGLVITDDYDFKGNLEKQERQLALDYINVIDWSSYLGSLPQDPTPADYLTATSSALSSESFTHAYEYDALNRPTKVTTPDDSVTEAIYNAGGLLESVSVKVHGGASVPIVHSIDYDEKGRRAKVVYSDPSGEHFFTEYRYHPLTYRVEHFKTTRPGPNPPTTSVLLQSLAYFYDAVGNITKTKDTATQSVYFTAAPTPSSSDGDYTYDAIYRLIQASGREHEGTVADTQYDEQDVAIRNVPHPNNPNGFRAYTQTYVYDEVGNIIQMVHGLSSSTGEWSRDYEYVSGTNRLSTTSHTGGDKSYPHDDHGNINAMSHLPTIDWDFADQMRHVVKSGGGDVYFVYDASGQRIRKVWVRSGLIDERIYLGGYELWRQHTGTSIPTATLDEERQTLHVADDARRVCMIETLTITAGAAVSPLAPRYRFQLDDHLGTVAVEVDQVGAVISYEEYHPYGTSAYRAWKTGVEVSAKRYRYTGKERDEETGLYYHGARYYAPWLGRWTAADPAGTVDGTNLYAYVRGSPIGLRDPNGTQSSSRTHELQVEIGYLQQTIESGTVEGDEAAELTLRLNKLQAELGDLATPEPEPFTPAPPEFGTQGGVAAEPEKTRITIPHMEGVPGSVLPQVPSIEDRGSAAENAANYILGWAYNLEALVISAVAATVQGTDEAAVRHLKNAGLSDLDIQAIRDLGLLHGAEISQAINMGATGLRALAAYARAGGAQQSKAWTDFLPQATKRVAASKKKLGVSDEIVNMAISRKQALNRMEGLQFEVEAHLKAIYENPHSRDVEHWKTEIRAFISQIERLSAHTGKKTSAEWARKIADWRSRLGE